MAEVDRAALGIGQAAVIEHLQEHVEDVRVGLLHLIKQQNRIGTPTHRLGELATFLVTDVSRRCTEKPGHGIALHELAHVQADQGFFLIEEGRRQGFGEFGLAHTGGAEEEKGTDRTAGILHAGTGAADRRGHRPHGLPLADHPLRQALLELQQLLALTRHQALDRDPGPAGHHIGNIPLFHLFPQQGLSALLTRLELLLQFVAALLHAMELVVLQPGRLLEIAIPFGLGDLQA